MRSARAQHYAHKVIGHWIECRTYHGASELQAPVVEKLNHLIGDGWEAGYVAGEASHSDNSLTGDVVQGLPDKARNFATVHLAEVTAIEHDPAIKYDMSGLVSAAFINGFAVGMQLEL